MNTNNACDICCKLGAVPSKQGKYGNWYRVFLCDDCKPKFFKDQRELTKINYMNNFRRKGGD